MATIPEGVTPFEFEDVVAEVTDERALAELLAGYRKYLIAQRERLRQAVGQGRFEETHRVAHAIRGGALTLGATALARAAERVEKSATGGGWTGIERLVAELSSEMDALLRGMAQSKSGRRN